MCIYHRTFLLILWYNVPCGNIKVTHVAGQISDVGAGLLGGWGGWGVVGSTFLRTPACDWFLLLDNFVCGMVDLCLE